MIRDALSPTLNDISCGYVERQKIRDQTGKVNEIYRAQAREELVRETIAEAIKNLPEIELQYAPRIYQWIPDRQLIVAFSDIHYGANIRVEGLNGDVLNEFNHEVFEKRMEKLLDEVVDIIRKENINHVYVFLVGDLLDGMIRQTQLMRLEYGLIESTIRISEYLAHWFSELAAHCGVVDVYASSGNHSEVRPLKSKKREYPDENMERIIIWYLSERLRGSNRVLIHDECKKYIKANVCGYSFLLLHGDSEKSIQDLSTEIIRQYKEPIDFFVCGHKHRESEYPSGITANGESCIIRVPSICGTDDYANSKGFYGNAGATAIVMEKGYGRRCIYPINLQ